MKNKVPCPGHMTDVAMTIARLKREEPEVMKTSLFRGLRCSGCQFAKIRCVDKVYGQKACGESSVFMSTSNASVFDVSKSSVLDYFYERFAALTLAGTNVEFETDAEGFNVPECVKAGSLRQLIELYDGYHSIKEQNSEVAFPNNHGSGLPGRYWYWHPDHPEFKKRHVRNPYYAAYSRSSNNHNVKTEEENEDEWAKVRKYQM